MRAEELISEYIPPIKYTESGEKALNWMNEFRVNHLAVVDGKNYIGIVSDDDIYDMKDPKNSLKSELPYLQNPFVYGDSHIYDVLKTIANAKITIVPVLNRNNEYIGCTDLLFLISQITAVSSMKEAGGVIVLEMNKHDYSLTQIARIVEENDAKILSSYVSSLTDSTNVQVTLKINSTEIDSILRTFERYDYFIKESYSEGEYFEDLKNRYDELMNYLKL
ncbi:CBS domain-containing protein [Putridiphycobacter roseus]|uniref:CBS domain-containing protein n=1 Tax=Putridiphycobacter roseus TaxID=2219161 RepID=A0A2W1NA64_9FLAO|nr:CBS domain-containing protein [Putridiphycobacter roseus]PZE16185.1 CBS domain-containing protein [Putridiphycobacter roseus]